MKISLGFEVSRSKSAGLAPGTVRQNGGFFGVIREAFTGAWQKNIEVESPQNILAFSAVYACVSRIADDISKMRIKLVEQNPDSTWTEVTRNSPFLPVLAKPNGYQTRIQFLSSWVTWKLLWGNAYIYKETDGRGVTVAMHVLDSRLVTPLISPSGAVYYQLRRSFLANVADDAPSIPAANIMHDRMITPWHPLVGVSPIYAAGSSATQGIRIQANSAKFFENMSRPSGMLTTPHNIPDETAARLKRDFENSFAGDNIGRLFVGGDALTYSPMTMPAHDAQLIEQLKWTVEDVARPFHVPLYKIGAGPAPTFNNVGALNQQYVEETLQSLMECVELLLTEGLGLPDVNGRAYCAKLDTDVLMRMDPLGQVAYLKDTNGILSPNEQRLRLNAPPVKGGDSPMVQQQYYSLEDLDKRDDKAPVVPEAPDLVPAPVNPGDGPPANVAPGTPPAVAEAAAKAIADAMSEARLELKELECTN